MRHLTERFLITLALSVFFPCLMHAQTEGKPPTCCSEDSAAASSTTVVSAPESISVSPIPQITISDETLASLGITRSGFLESLASGLFPDRAVYLTLPIPVEIYGASGENGGTVIYFQAPVDEVAPEVIDALDSVYVTDGEVFIQVFFVPNPTPANP